MKAITSVIAVAIMTSTMILGLGISTDAIQSVDATRRGSSVVTGPAAPIAISGDSAYIAWWSNKTGNDEVQFRASTDGGVTFADKINLSNSTDAESQDVEIAAEGNNVIISWWERNQTADEPVARISKDNGATFGPILKLATNGTIGSGGGSGTE